MKKLKNTEVHGVILIVDDDAGTRNLTRWLLAEHGFDISVARHGEEALACLRQRCPDLILLDLHMPVMDGWQFRQQQQALPDRSRAEARVLLLSGEDDAPLQAALLGAVGIVRKPFETRDLLDAVWAAIGEPPNTGVQHA